MHGRAGREKLEGNVVIQTYNPESFPIECAKEQDYLKFYEQEIKLRSVLKYPPFCDIIKLEVSGLNGNEVKKTITSIYENLLNNNDRNLIIYSPMPSPVSKIKNKYRWRIIIKCRLGNTVINEINNAIKNIKTNASISVDVNPNNMN